MIIGRFNAFFSCLNKEFVPNRHVTSFQVYRRSPDGWKDAGRNKVIDKDTVDALDLTMKKKGHWRGSNSLMSWYPVDKLESVIGVESPSPVKSKTRKKLNDSITQCFHHATASYEAAHDGLTGLLNFSALDKKIESLLEGLQVDGAVDSNTTTAPRVSISLLSLDIDHFKQINDSHGHDYGDIVLMCFSSRVSKFIEKLKKDYPHFCFEFGRVGGEEFSLVISGALTEENVHLIASRINTNVSENVLPTEDEWNELAAGLGKGARDLPNIHDRKVTSSIGVSSIVFPGGLDRRKLIDRIKKEADASLYRAKAGGRNTFRYFPSIRDRHGAVLEHHSDVEVVAIDIGKDVSVQVGHEFYVYHPDFTGEKHFVRSDGRSKKTMGMYPRISCGRLVVFDAQREISFCHIASKNGIKSFPVNSSIQFIPAGTITHLVSTLNGEALGGYCRMSKPEDFHNSVKSKAAEKNKFSVVTFVLRNSESLEASHGVATINRVLADLYHSIDSGCPSGIQIAQIGPFEISVLLDEIRDAQLTSFVESILSNADSVAFGVGDFCAGVFCSENASLMKMGVDFSCALDFSRFAASPLLIKDKGGINNFSEHTSHRLLGARRTAGSHEEGKYDYDKLKKAGVKGAYFHNQGALCYYESSEQDLDAAMIAINEAIDAQAEPIFYANRGLIFHAQGKSLEAYLDFVECDNAEGDFDLPDIYMKTRAIAAYRSIRQDPSLCSALKVRAWLIDSIAISSQSVVEVPTKDLLEALNMIEEETQDRVNDREMGSVDEVGP